MKFIYGDHMAAIFQRSMHKLSESGEAVKATGYLRDHLNYWSICDGEVFLCFKRIRHAEGFLAILCARATARITGYIQSLIENFVDSAGLLENAEFNALEWRVVVGADLNEEGSEGKVLRTFSLTADSIEKITGYPPLNNRVSEQIEDILRRKLDDKAG